MMNLDEILEAANRRRMALDAGSMHVPASLRSSKGPRPDAESSLDVPQLLWPLQRHLIPARCSHCGASGANFETDQPYGSIRHGEVRCLLCSRTVVRLKTDAFRPTVLTGEDLKPRRGRPSRKVAS